MRFLIHLYEPDICNEHKTSIIKEAKVISIYQNDYSGIILTVEIDLNYDPLDVYDHLGDREHIPEIITRKLDVYNIYDHGIRLEAEKKTFFQCINSF